MTTNDADRRLAEASRALALELDKQGTPDYDQRSHERAIEAHRAALRAAGEGGDDASTGDARERAASTRERTTG